MSLASFASWDRGERTVVAGGFEPAGRALPVAPGDDVAGSEIIDELGRGTDTVVYRVRRHGHDYALKLLDSPRSDPAEALRLFRREAALLAGVDHPGLPRILETGQHGQLPYLLMDLVQGSPLGRLLAAGPLPVARAVALATDVAGALAALHRTGLVHRDIKPDNVMVLPSGEGRLIDFGLATATAVEERDLAVGTFAYASPEQAGTLKRPVDQRSDLYSLGIVLYACVTGTLPFVSDDVGELLRMHAVVPAPDPTELVDGVGPGLAAVIRMLLAKDPDDRYQSAEVLLGDLRKVAADPAAAAFEPAQEPPPPPPREPLSGRTAELDELVDRWDRAAQGHGGTVLIRGAAGAGKSRLAGELAGLAEVQGALLLQGKSSPDDTVPLAPLRAAVDGYLQAVAALPEDQRAEAHDRLRAAAGPAAPLLGALSQSLGRLLAAERLAEEDRHEQFHAAVAAFFTGLARLSGGLVLLLDDVQWLDGATRRVLRQVSAGLAGTPLLLVATARDDADSAGGTGEFEAAVGDSLDVRQSLAPLDDHAVARMVASRLPGIDTGSHLARLLNVRGDGNPFVIREYLHAVIDAGLLRPSWGGWLVDEEALDALELPQDALGLVLTRVRSLPADSRHLLTVAAVTGSRFRSDLVADVCRLDRGYAADLLREATGRALVEPRGDGRYAFLHDRIREALLVELDRPDTAELHRRIARVLDSADAREPADVYALARHYTEGGDPGREPARDPRVVAACLAAGRLAVDDHAPDRAITYLSQAEAAGADPDSAFLRLFGMALARDGRHAEARERFDRALSVEHDPLRRADLYVLLANVYRATWDTTGALGAVQSGLAEAGSPWRSSGLMLALSTIRIVVVGALVALTTLGAGRAIGKARERFSLVCELHEVAAYVCIIGMLPEQMVLHGLRSLNAAARLGPSPQYVRAVGSLGLTAGALGLHRLARRIFAPARRVAAGLADPRLIADVATQEGAAAFLGGADDGQIWEQAMTEHGRWLDAGRYSDGVAALCWELASMGRTAEALSWYRQGRARLRGRDETTALVTFEAFSLALEGRFAEAAAELERVNTLLDGHGGKGLRINAVLMGLQALLEQENVGSRFDERLAEFALFGIRPLSMIRSHRMFAVFDAYGRLVRCRADRPGTPGGDAAGRLADAAAAVRRLRRVASTPLLQAFHQTAQAELATLRGSPAVALRLLAALPPARRDAPMVSFHVSLARARALRAGGHHEEALRHARFAQSVAVHQQWPHREQQIMVEFRMAPMPESLIRAPTSTHLVAGESVYRLRLQALEEIGKAAARVLDPDALARIALDEIIRILNADRAFLFLSAPDGRLLPHLGRDGSDDDVEKPTAYSATLVERVRATGEPLVVTGTSDAVADLSASVVLHGLRSIMAAPIQLDGRLIGVVYLDSRVAKGIFTRDDVGILTALTNHIATSLATARAAQLEVSVQTARQQRDVAETLRDALTRMSREHDPARVLIHLIDTAARVLPCDDAWLVVRSGHHIEIIGTSDATGERPRWTVPSDPALAAVFHSPAPVVGTGAAPPPGLPADAVRVGDAWMALPLPARHSGLGALILSSARGGVYQDAQVELGSALAVQGAIAYDNASLFAQVQALATVDELTGVPNRRGFFDTAGREVQRAHRTGAPLAAVMVDIDHFKRINDGHGHATGDEVIRAVAARLADCARGSGTTGRYGGEEFAVIMSGTDSATAVRAAEALRAAVRDSPIETRSGPLTVTVSLGVATLQPGDDVATVLARADEGLYRAKNAGRDQVCVAAGSERPVAYT